MMMMQMWFYWGCECTFFFKDWKIEKGNTLGFLLACLACAAFCLIGPVIRSIKDSSILKTKNENEVNKHLIIGLQLLSFIHDSLMMLLIMTYNWGVVIAVLIGYGAGYVLFNLKEEYDHPEKENYVDCC